ncbi:MAG: endonuclease III domain-containing protein [Syntrophales bacterium]|nr:endonuclease III domain-containing protein [Syntrophales bacterium]
MRETPERKLIRQKKSGVTPFRTEIGLELVEIYDRMNGYFGDLHWWPGETPLEVALGAILTQNTAWTNVERAIERLRAAGLLEAAKLYRVGLPELAETIRSVGFYNLKATRLKSFLEFMHVNHGASMEEMFKRDTYSLRQELLSVRGIGPETADSILLYGDNRPVFVVDAYTRRILERHGFIDHSWGYEEIQKLFMNNLPREASLYNQYHALIVNTGKHFCGKKKMCVGCPLETFVPAT